MIRLPKEIADMIKTIEDAGFEAYAVGGCVRDSILGRHPEDWDLTSNASRDTLEALFPDAAIVNKKLGVMRISKGGVAADIAAYRIDGEYRDHRRPETVIFTEEIGEDLRRRDFTMNAIAVSPERGVIDPYCGRADIDRKLIRGIGDPRARFEEDALRILRAVRFAAQLDFDIDEDTLRSMSEKAGLLKYISEERIREEFSKIAASKSSGRGLKISLETGVLPYVLGDHWMQSGSMTELDRIARLADHIDLAEPELSVRLALIYECLEQDRAFRAIDWLGYSNVMKKLLFYAVGLSPELEGITDKTELKRFIGRIGLEHYKYLEFLSEQRDIVYHRSNESRLLRSKLFRDIREGMEAIFIQDLAVDGNDLREAGIAEGTEIGRILRFLLDVVHQAPEKNEKQLLLKIAAEKHMEHEEC